MSFTPLQPPAPHGASAPVAPARTSFLSRIPGWGWVLIGIAAILLFLTMSSLIATMSLVVLITSIVALAKDTPTWLSLNTKRSRQIATAVSGVLLLVSSSYASATAAPSRNAPVEEPRAFVEVVATPTTEPAPVESGAVIELTEAIPFEKSTVDDPNVPKGTQTVTTVGVNGERTKVYQVLYVDGVEKSRTLISDMITTTPVTEITTNGTYVEPVYIAAPPPAPPAQDSGCDPNYADGCVPIDSDVDCGGGSGNGPSYFYGTARVVGSDIYGLDSDGDGWACE